MMTNPGRSRLDSATAARSGRASRHASRRSPRGRSADVLDIAAPLPTTWSAEQRPVPRLLGESSASCLPLEERALRVLSVEKRSRRGGADPPALAPGHAGPERRKSVRPFLSATATSPSNSAERSGRSRSGLISGENFSVQSRPRRVLMRTAAADRRDHAVSVYLSRGPSSPSGGASTSVASSGRRTSAENPRRRSASLWARERRRPSAR